jgi:hypothetical protein
MDNLREIVGRHRREVEVLNRQIAARDGEDRGHPANFPRSECGVNRLAASGAVACWQFDAGGAFNLQSLASAHDCRDGFGGRKFQAESARHGNGATGRGAGSTGGG